MLCKFRMPNNLPIALEMLVISRKDYNCRTTSAIAFPPSLPANHISTTPLTLLIHLSIIGAQVVKTTTTFLFTSAIFAISSSCSPGRNKYLCPVLRFQFGLMYPTNRKNVGSHSSFGCCIQQFIARCSQY